jgi:hypothetical protein
MLSIKKDGKKDDESKAKTKINRLVHKLNSVYAILKAVAQTHSAN